MSRYSTFVTHDVCCYNNVLTRGSIFSLLMLVVFYGSSGRTILIEEPHAFRKYVVTFVVLGYDVLREDYKVATSDVEFHEP